MANNYLESMLGNHERIILVSRQHWFVIARAILFEVSSLLILLALATTGGVLFPQFGVLIVALVFVFMLIPLFTMTLDIMHWVNQQFIITNRRVIQISGVINKNVTDSSLEKVNDVKMVQSVSGRMFGYGDIEILTASEQGANTFKIIDEPIRFKTAMLNAKEQVEINSKHSITDESTSRSIPVLIEQMDKLRANGLITEEEFQSKKKELLARL